MLLTKCCVLLHATSWLARTLPNRSIFGRCEAETIVMSMAASCRQFDCMPFLRSTLTWTCDGALLTCTPEKEPARASLAWLGAGTSKLGCGGGECA